MPLVAADPTVAALPAPAALLPPIAIEFAAVAPVFAPSAVPALLAVAPSPQAVLLASPLSFPAGLGPDICFSRFLVRVSTDASLPRRPLGKGRSALSAN